MDDIAKIAAGLNKFTRADLLAADPERVVAPVATLLDLALSGLADMREDNTVFLTPLGIALRAHIGESHD